MLPTSTTTPTSPAGTAVEGFIGAPVYTELPTAVGKAWQTDYMAKTHGDTSTGPTADYDSILLLAAAIEKAGTVDPDAVNKVLPTVTVEGTTGETRFGGADVLGIPHLLERPINVVEVKNGKIVSVFSGWPSRITATMSPSPSPVTAVGWSSGRYHGPALRRASPRPRVGRRGGRRSAGPHRERVWQHK